MTVMNTILWIVGVYLKYSMLYGVGLGLTIGTILSYVENSQLQKDKTCQRHLLTNIPQLVFLSIAILSLIFSFFLKDFAQSLIDSNA